LKVPREEFIFVFVVLTVNILFLRQQGVGELVVFQTNTREHANSYLLWTHQRFWPRQRTLWLMKASLVLLSLLDQQLLRVLQSEKVKRAIHPTVNGHLPEFRYLYLHNHQTRSSA
jgi:hypothetical protein